MSEMSQVERAALVAACEREATGPGLATPIWIAARDYMEERHVERMAPVVSALADSKERERALEEALRFYADPIRLIKFVEQHNRADANDRERGAGWWAQKLSTIASDALAASQPEVLSERNDTEPGEPEGQPGYNALLDLERRVLDVTEPVAGVLNDLGIEGPSYKSILEKVEESVRTVLQPDHGSGEPSYALKRLKSWRDILERETTLESRENDEQVEVEGRVLHNLKQAIDAVLMGESNG